MPESYNLFSIGIDNENKNIEYINKNGKLYNSTKSLENSDLSQSITRRITGESTSSDCEVVVFGTESAMAKKIQKSTALKKFLSENMEALKKINLYLIQQLNLQHLIKIYTAHFTVQKLKIYL